MAVTLSSKGQITLPKGIRELLALKPSDKVDFTPEPDGRITVTKATRASQTSFAALRGMLPKPKCAFSVAEMNKAVQDSAAARVALVKLAKRSKL
jgi:antitoxin PrlF